MPNKLRVTLEVGPKGKKVVAVAQRPKLNHAWEMEDKDLSGAVA